MPPDTTAALRQAAAGLTYQSETDAPWEVVSWPDATGAPTAEGVLRVGKHRKTAKVEEQGLEDFFAPLVRDEEWYGPEEKAVSAKYRDLLETVRRLLTAPKVFRVGSRKAAVYVLGEAPEGGWGGLKTTAVET